MSQQVELLSQHLLVLLAATGTTDHTTPALSHGGRIRPARLSEMTTMSVRLSNMDDGLADSLDDDDLRERVAAHEAEATELREQRATRVKALRAQGVSFRDIAARLGVSVATAHADSAEMSTSQIADAYIRDQAGRKVPSDVDANEWLRARFGRNGRRNDARAAVAQSLRRSAGLPDLEEDDQQ